MDPSSPSFEKRLAPEIQLALEQHDKVLRLSYMEIASGINRLLRQGIPKEVVSQVLDQTVEALAKEVRSSPRRSQL